MVHGTMKKDSVLSWENDERLIKLPSKDYGPNSFHDNPYTIYILPDTKEDKSMVYEEKMLCSSCNHREVCAYREQFFAAQKAVDGASVLIGEGSYTPIREIRWIKPVALKCTFFSEKQQLRQLFVQGPPMNDKDE